MIYLDYMATTPIDPEVSHGMMSCLNSPENFGNSSSQNHHFGLRAASLIEYAREQTASLINADPAEIIWTSGATEADNLALKGAALFYQRKGKHIITMASEHKAVLNTCAYLENLGFEVSYLKPNHQGLLNLDELKSSIRPDTILASIMWVNNETGVIQNIPEISQITRKNGVILHVDGTQAIGKIPVDLKLTEIDLFSFSAHKFHGPKGIGALYVRRRPRIRLYPQIHGGDQEQGLRSGTLPTHQIIGMGIACTIAKQQLAKDYAHAVRLSERLWQGLQSLPGMQLNSDRRYQIPHCLNLSFHGIEAETLLVSVPKLALSTGSACHTAHTTPSHVLTAMGLSSERANSAIRISYGRMTTEEEIDQAIHQLTVNIRSLRELSPIWQ